MGNIKIRKTKQRIEKNQFRKRPLVCPLSLSVVVLPRNTCKLTGKSLFLSFTAFSRFYTYINIELLIMFVLRIFGFLYEVI